MKINDNINLLGMNVEDKVTAIKGIITSISFDLYGCIQALVVQKQKNNTEYKSNWFDLNRLKIISRKRVMKIPDFDFVDIPSYKGPANKPIK